MGFGDRVLVPESRLHGGSALACAHRKVWRGIRAIQTTHGLRTAETEQMRRLVREPRADTERLVELL